ncbi:hypothetical protein SO802_004738 [Lithocarpus litseifolius]|uniref:RWP-RK domain-containing protein n=1 Tax=Lithocarpus litseifolius TaxID=425828 RepID=A0AAW2E5T2_9ROSI
MVQRDRAGKLTLEEVGRHFHLPIEEASRRMKLCPTVLKKICRRYGIHRWPYRKVKSIRRQISNLTASLNSHDAEGEARANAQAEIDRLQQELTNVCAGVSIDAATEGLAADCAGLGNLFEEAIAFGYLLVISRLEGKSVMPSNASCDGLIHCCDHNEIRDTLISAIDQMDTIQLCIIAWPNQTCPFNTNIQPIGASSLCPPIGRIFFPDT